MKTPIDIIKEHYSCVCIDAYKNRGLADPHCVLCREADEMAEIMEEYAKEEILHLLRYIGRPPESTLQMYINHKLHK